METTTTEPETSTDDPTSAWTPGDKWEEPAQTDDQTSESTANKRATYDDVATACARLVFETMINDSRFDQVPVGAVRGITDAINRQAWRNHL